MFKSSFDNKEKAMYQVMFYRLIITIGAILLLLDLGRGNP